MRDKHIVDSRIHCCLYFIRPSGHSLKPIDIIVMKKLADVVNVVPVIAKADTLTMEERAKFKETVSASSRAAGWSPGRLCLQQVRTDVYGMMPPNYPQQIRNEMAYHNIRSYPFDNEELDAEEQQFNDIIRVSVDLRGPWDGLWTARLTRTTTSPLCDVKQSMIPYAVIGSERSVLVDGKPVRGRKNKWGVINVENEQHCDFTYLRNFLTR